jgi:hypothetical protein
MGNGLRGKYGKSRIIFIVTCFVKETEEGDLESE